MSRTDYHNYDGFYYPTYHSYSPRHKLNKAGTIGIVIEIYQKYGYFSDRYYKIKWSDTGDYSNEKHEDLILISHYDGTNKD